MAHDGPGLAYSTAEDDLCDVIVRRTDAGGGAPYDPQLHHPPDVVEIVVGNWQPTDPQTDLFSGTFASSGIFLRLEVALNGLQNPPGSTSVGSFAPYQFGPHPVYGFLEFDVDRQIETGGETAAPEFRYLANVARYGGVPAGSRFDDRVLRQPDDDDGDFDTSPYIERSGEEFHLALLPSSFAAGDITRLVGDSDTVFEAGETWSIPGNWFHRAHGFEPFSFAKGGGAAGEYMPQCRVRFSHSITADLTTITLVFPLTNVAAAAMTGAAPQANNADPSDQASVDEALDDLVQSAQFLLEFPSGEPEEILIRGWADENPSEFLAPRLWPSVALLGSSYSAAGFGLVWSDVLPNPMRGDVDGEHGIDHEDSEKLAEYLDDHDLDDGTADDRVAILGFPQTFAVFDISGNGIVDSEDFEFLSDVGDTDLDQDVDLADFGRIQGCSGRPAVNACGIADLNRDGQVSGTDACWFFQRIAGPN